LFIGEVDEAGRRAGQARLVNTSGGWIMRQGPGDLVCEEPGSEKRDY
jgi:hypothetical protein